MSKFTEAIRRIANGSRRSRQACCVGGSSNKPADLRILLAPPLKFLALRTE